MQDVIPYLGLIPFLLLVARIYYYRKSNTRDKVFEMRYFQPSIFSPFISAKIFLVSSIKFSDSPELKRIKKTGNRLLYAFYASAAMVAIVAWVYGR